MKNKKGIGKRREKDSFNNIDYSNPIGMAGSVTSDFHR
jgi:hypothetical protein